jgi:hypothetical protein
MSYTHYASVPKTSTLAIVSLVSGILTWIIFPILGALTAVITGHLAKREIHNSLGGLTGDGLATAGLILGYIQLVLVFGGICIIMILALLGPSIGGVFSDILNNL